MIPISVIVVTHDSSLVLEDFLEQLGSGRELDDEIIVVDSGSSELGAIETTVRNHDAELLAYRLNIGYGAASNRGAEVAKNAWLAFVNPDVETSVDDFRSLAEEASSHGISCLGPKIVDTAGIPIQVSGRTISPPWRASDVSFTPSGSLTYVESISGCCMLMPASTFRELGGFDEFFFMFCEEIDLHKRIRERGGTVAMTASICVRTPGSGSSSTTSRRWSMTERAVAHVRYTYKHFGLWAGLTDLLWRCMRILWGGEFRPRLVSFRQFFVGSLSTNRGRWREDQTK